MNKTDSGQGKQLFAVVSTGDSDDDDDDDDNVVVVVVREDNGHSPGYAQ